MPRQKGTPKTGGRKAGQLNKASLDIKRMVRLHADKAVAELIRLCTESESDAVRVAAIRELLDRGYGKATQPHAGDEDGAPIKQTITICTGVPRD
jgi:hypothetical protein